jgi:uncharacterized protein YjiS (DUF1127 family)
VNKRSMSGTFADHAGSAAPGSGLRLAVTDFLLAQVQPRAAGAWRIILEWRRRQRSRQALRLLSLREIRDFSPDLSVAEREARKPFWRA